MASWSRFESDSKDQGTIGLVSPQNWYHLGSYRRLREYVLQERHLNLVCDLGPAAFHDMNWWAARTSLTIISRFSSASRWVSILDATGGRSPEAKALNIGSEKIIVVDHADIKSNPDNRILMQASEGGSSLRQYANAYQGITSGDNDRFRFLFWEIISIARGWSLLQATFDNTDAYVGKETIVWWGSNGEHIARPQGMAAWGRIGVAISQMRHLPATLSDGVKFDMNASVIVPTDPEHLPAIWAFCSSPNYASAVRRVDQALKVTNATLVKVRFDLVHWQQVAAEKYPNGLPDPYSDDPTQWLFHGHPRHAIPGTELHVALARLAGYRWPAETDPAMRLSAQARARIAEAATLPPGDADGLLSLVPVLGERPLADRLRAFCAAAWDDAWTPAQEAALITAACDRAKDKPPRQLTLEAWLRTHAARQHAKLFHDRPFLWWITDGRADGFTAVAHYHRLTRVNLERLAYTVLGDWLTRLGDDPKAEAARVLQAKLALILTGEAPHDIFVRWKPLHAQPLGWDPDLDDGVRQNTRPFLQAEVLSYAPNILKAVDRGNDVASAPWFPVFKGVRRNDHHTTLAEKQQARRVP